MSNYQMRNSSRLACGKSTVYRPKIRFRDLKKYYLEDDLSVVSSFGVSRIEASPYKSQHSSPEVLRKAPLESTEAVDFIGHGGSLTIKEQEDIYDELREMLDVISRQQDNMLRAIQKNKEDISYILSVRPRA